MEGIFSEITVIIVFAAAFSLLFRFIHQPPILAYIVTGILLGPLGLFHLQHIEDLRMLGQLGITLLLFMLGLELKLHELRSLGKTVLIAGIAQMWFTFFLCLSLLLFLGLDRTSSLYLAAAISFSSTIVIVKILSDKKDLTSLHGKLAIGILLVQDFFAVLTIAILTGVHAGGDLSFISLQIGWVIVKMGILSGIVYFLSTRLSPYVLHRIAKTPELLFLFSLAWVFVFAAIVSSPAVGFSIEIGGFLAGLAFANAAENFQIVAKMRALRDFFITIFFVVLGLQMRIENIGAIIFQALVLTIFVLTAKPLIVMVITHFLGYKKRTAFMVGITMGQISEFSLILLFLGFRLGHLTSDTISLALFVSIITFALSTYIMQNGNVLYKKLIHHLRFLDTKHVILESTIEAIENEPNLKNHVVIVGGDHMGESILRSLEESGEKALVVDFNPDIVKRMQNRGVQCLFGDIADIDIQQRAGLDSARLVISTVPDMEDNLLLIEGLAQMNKRAKIIVMAIEGQDAKTLYKAGADYVVLPHLAGGRHVARLLKDMKHDGIVSKYREKDLQFLT